MGRAKGMTKNAWAWFNSLGERIMRFGNSISLSLSLSRPIDRCIQGT